MSNSHSSNDPMDFTRNLWGKMGFSLPGMVTPTFDVDELEKRLVDLKAVEGWLKMNLSMLQLTIQTLEMQCSTLNAVRQIGNIKLDQVAGSASPGAASTSENASAADSLQSAMWPWTLMQQLQTQMQQQMQEAIEKQSDLSAAKTTK